MFPFTRSVLIGLAVGGLCLAADWKRTPFPGWSDETVLKLLTDSPWSKPKTVQFTWHKPEERPFTYKDVPGADPSKGGPIGSPVGGIGGKIKTHLPDKGDILIRWASALPIGHAKALYRLRDEKLPASKLNALIPAPAGSYVLEIFGLPVEMAHLGAGSIELLARQNITLRTRSGRVLRPARVETKVGPNVTILVHFSRDNPIVASDQELEVSGDLQIFRFRERFRLSEMRYQDRLEI
jgi:hypothetical protein